MNANCGVILIDHGSRVPASNGLLDEVVAMFRNATGHSIVEPAHMELADPDLESAFRRCLALGAETIVIHPYFLGPGRHVREDIPRLAAAAAAANGQIPYVITEPLGIHPAMTTIIQDRISQAQTRQS